MSGQFSSATSRHPHNPLLVPDLSDRTTPHHTPHTHHRRTVDDGSCSLLWNLAAIFSLFIFRNFIQHFRIAFGICFPFGHAPYHTILQNSSAFPSKMALPGIILMAATTGLWNLTNIECVPLKSPSRYIVDLISWPDF